ncbi:uncharacterized protein EV420DRAFT_1666255 [Desarmillaria tabescens]|uniref:DUF6534 domain-containing protein n=1 Tax=Armillaria tabescens TaxID=1929756 RepID=A0AA39NAR4_ARMTA|nr:uncharacterized protein EV420DRAFT_1666255 [Desarmillaria tabescens]KAK0462098.1 hypothetical protein EV420DRAFT_1666255 [Desarmillaria tabescens]
MPEKFDDTFGCMFISFSLDLMCYGAGFLAVLQYFRHGYGSKDSVAIKAMVLTLGFLATVHVATFIAWAYDDLISRFGAFEKLDDMPRTALVQLLAIYMVSFISQCFFTTRIWILTHKWYLAGPIAILALINIIAGITQTTLSGIGGTFSNLINTEKVTSLQASATAACDLLITATLCWILNKKRTGIKTTDTLLDNLIILAINRGAVTSLAALFNLILFVWRLGAMIFMIPLLPSCQFYVLSVVGRSLRDDGRDAVTLPLEPMSGSESSTGGPGGVQVSTSVVSWKDGSQFGSHKDTGTGIDKYLPSSVSV